MVSDALFASMAAHAAAEFRRRNPKRTSARVGMSEFNECAAEFEAYLLEPYSEGYWSFRAEWIFASPLARFLESQLTLLTQDIEEIATNDAYTAYRTMRYSERETLSQISSGLNSMTRLFAVMNHKLQNDGSQLYDAGMRSRDEGWIERIDIVKLSETFPDALAAFRSHLSARGSLSALGTDIVEVDSGAVGLVEHPQESGFIELISSDQRCCEAFSQFFAGLGTVRFSSVQRIFSPNDALFKPYLALLDQLLPVILQNDEDRDAFRRALTFNELKHPKHCISALGLIAERYISSIYASVIRDEPIAAPLGVMILRLDEMVKDALQPKNSTPPPLDKIYTQITELGSEVSPATLKTILRSMVELLKAERSETSRRISEIQKPTSGPSLFPKRIKERIDELVKWRNAAAHYSRDEVGDHEAARTAYCLVRLIRWWETTRKEVDWSRYKHEVLQALVARAQSQNAANR